MEDYRLLYEIGDHIMIELTCEDILEGRITNVGPNRINIKEVKLTSDQNRELVGIYSFYRQEIYSIKIMKPKSFCRTCRYADGNSLSDQLESLELNDVEYNRLRNVTKQYTYIDKADARYFSAVETLSRAETIGIACPGLERTRTGTLKILVCCTWDKVFIFDFADTKYSYFYPELRRILEADYTCKIMHEGGKVIDVLYNKYKVYMRNIFDTQVVDLIIQKKQKNQLPDRFGTMSDLLSEYLKFPVSYLKPALDITISQWEERPLTEKCREYAAQLVTYLPSLKSRLEKVLFSEVYNAIQNVHQYYYGMECYDFAVSGSVIPKEIKNMIPDLGTPDKKTD